MPARAGAALAWRSAELAAPNEAERAAIEKRRRDYEQRRHDLEAAERKRQEEERARELQKLKDEALASIRAAELKASAKEQPADPNRKVVEWWEGPKAEGSVRGKLERVDCLRGPARLVIRDAQGKVSQYLITDPGKVVISGGGEQAMGCGPQKPPRAVKIEFSPKKDAKQGTEGEVMTIEFP